jgi:hypothetical protein
MTYSNGDSDVEDFDPVFDVPSPYQDCCPQCHQRIPAEPLDVAIIDGFPPGLPSVEDSKVTVIDGFPPGLLPRLAQAHDRPFYAFPAAARAGTQLPPGLVFRTFREDGFPCTGVFVGRVRDFIYPNDVRMFFVLDPRPDGKTVPRFVYPDPANQGQYIHRAPMPGEWRPVEPWMVVWEPVFDGLSREERRVRVGAYISLWLANQAILRVRRRM